jgi:hypothetical protein
LPSRLSPGIEHRIGLFLISACSVAAYSGNISGAPVVWRTDQTTTAQPAPARQNRIRRPVPL